jgi:hypothetical protein
MFSFVQKTALFKVTVFSLFCTVAAFAAVDAEMEGMEVDSQDNGTFLVGGPTFYFDRVLGAGGLHSESELWSPAKLRQRLLFNRMSVLPSWDPHEPSIWLKTGNELGDLIYRDFITSEDRPSNRTPILEGGFRIPSFKGFWVTGRAFQDDHFSTATMSARKKWVSDEFAFFGENYPLFSTLYAGGGYSSGAVDIFALAGEEYLWMFTESSRWIPVHYKPRAEVRADVENLAVTVAYEDGEYQNKSKKETGERKEWNGSLRYRCGDVCRRGVLQLSAGLAFRMVDDEGTVYSELDHDRVLLPFMELRVAPTSRLVADAAFAINDRDWLVQDSVEFRPATPKNSGVLLGVKNISGTRLNPLADNREFYDGDTISLTANGQMNLVQGYSAFADTVGNVGLGGRGSFWAEHGAETFNVRKFVKDDKMVYRHGDVSRINTWIRGVTGELWFSTWYGEMFSFTALGGFERIDGNDNRFEVTPVEFFTSFTADWLLRKSFRISHSLRYRSDAQWNLRSDDPLVVKGDWYWDATFEQQFPKYGLFLTGTLLHVLGDEVIETPNGAENRLRFVCQVRKTF